ncbi:MAG: hypothetical protein AABX61_03535 [Nanoarchaeota archaeon]
MKKLLLILMFLLVLNLVSAQVAIKEVTSQPDKVQPGERITLSILLENVENKDIKNVAIKLDLTNLPFAPVDSATEQVLDQINNEDSRLVVFNLITLPEAESKIYKIPVKISYDNISKDTIISINVEAKPKLDLVLEDSQVVKVNDNGKIIIKLVNLGLTGVKSLRLTLLPNPDYEILSTNTIYISNIDVEDFETAEFTIIPNQRNPKLLFNLNYKDTNNEEYAENKQIQLNVYTLDEAKKLGLVQNNILFTILIPAIALILIYIAYRRFRKK